MKTFPAVLAILVSITLTLNSFAQLQSRKDDGGWRAQSIPVGNLFERSQMLDMEADNDGVVWILGPTRLFYVLNEGVFEFDLKEDTDGSNLIFISGPKDDRLKYIGRYGITEINGLHAGLKHIDLRAKLNLDAERRIRYAQRDIDNSLLILVGDDDERELWRLDHRFEHAELLTDDLQRPAWIHVLEDRIILSGKGVDILWRLPESDFRVERAETSHLSLSAQNYLKGIYNDDDFVYLASREERIFIYDIKADSLSYHSYTDRIEYFWIDDRGEFIILDEEQHLRNGDGRIILNLKEENIVEGEAPKVLPTNGSRGFTIGQNLWITSPDGLTLINRRKSKFKYTSTGERTDRVTTVIEDTSADRAYVLTSTKGLFIYKLSDGTLIKNLVRDELGHAIEGFKWDILDDQLYVYGLNGLYRFDKEEEKLKVVVDPFNVNEKVLPNRLNTMVCHPERKEVILGTKDNNLIRYHASDGRMDLIPLPKNTEGRNLVYELGVLPDGNILALTERGFFHLDMGSNSCTQAHEVFPNILSESNPALSGFQIMTDTSMLVSTFGQGMFVYDFQRDSTYRPLGDAFLTADISDVFYDDISHVYATSKLGLLSYSIPTNTIRSITIDEGLVSQNIHYRYMHRQAPGEMMLGLINGYVKFNSTDLEQGPGGNLLFNTFLVNGTPFSHEVEQGARIELDYTKNNLQITPASTILHKMNPLNYQARLTGLHDDWRTVPQGRAIRYDALAPGNYRCEIIDINSDQEPLSVEIFITAPFWRQAWFIALAIVLISAVVFTIVRLRMAYLRKESKLKAKHQLELAQLEMKSLRAQMNPHFLFNSLNSIKSFIAQNEPRIATRYLTKFSHLIRLILNNSRESRVSLAQELKALELYIELEQLRFEHSFDYSFLIDPLLDPDSILVPPLILQPYVENAIWHGLLHKEGERRLEIEVGDVSDGILMTIRDNGIGREAAKEIKSKTATKHKSLGMTITADRISKVHDGLSFDGVVISDLVAPNGDPIGTEVQIHLPSK